MFGTTEQIRLFMPTSSTYSSRPRGLLELVLVISAHLEILGSLGINQQFLRDIMFFLGLVLAYLELSWTF